ncbi:unnamed protein product [Clavelina lepadiformis]|uniref:Uncharacterized protein n=1 Tax=Clavelina lepadiformis TaxID=159417 RepID=A0ABP0G432_CLALP
MAHLHNRRVLEMTTTTAQKCLPYLALIQVKDRGSLITPSAGVVTVVRQAEKLFRAAVCGFKL